MHGCTAGNVVLREKFRGRKLNVIKLKYEVAERVENGAILIYLNRTEKVRPVPDYCVRARINALMREVY